MKGVGSQHLGVRPIGAPLFVVALLLAFAFTAVLPIRAAGALSSGAADELNSGTNRAPLAGYRLAGAAPAALGLVVNLEIPLRNQGEMASLSREVSDPSSPLFRHFLTPGEVSEDFEPTAQFNSILNYLHGAGLPVLMTAMNSIIVVRATVAQMKQYLDTDVNMYTNGTYSFYLSGASSFAGASVFASNSTTLLLRPDLVLAPTSSPMDNVTFVGGEFSAKSLRSVYNATSLYAQGYSGANQTIGILDFDGSATAASDLASYNSIFGLPSANLSVYSIGPYDPNLGSAYGWDAEIALDLEASHTMAPQAGIDLYIGSQSLPLSSIIASIVGADKVTTLSQSFGYGCECGFSFFEPGPLLDAQAVLTDQYYMLGGLEGITIVGATGDFSATGSSTGPAGGVSYPESSPWVTAVGGTQTYVYSFANGTEKFAQDAWSPFGDVSEGGNGGVSYLEPKPWFQASQTTPASFPNGRMEPDLSLQSGLDPATEIVAAGAVIGIGGTSEASPLLAGLMTLVAQATGGNLGLITPFLYSLGNNAAAYTKAFNPITVGYNIPWTTSSGYNLVTGWGAPNVGELEHYYESSSHSNSPEVVVSVVNSTGGSQIEYSPGQLMDVTANITQGGSPVTGGAFVAGLSTISGPSLASSMTYNASERVWTAVLTMGQQAGIAYLVVTGSNSAGVSAEGLQELFAGYTGDFLNPIPTAAYTTVPAAGGVQVVAQPEDLAGNTITSEVVSVDVASYSILTNEYSQIGTLSLSPATSDTYGPVVAAVMNESYPAGPINLMMQGDTWGFLPFIEGIDLANTVIAPTVFSAPGSVAPGQSIFLVANPGTPFNLGCQMSLDDGVLGSYCTDVSTSSNVTATLYSPSGVAVSSASLLYQPCAQGLRVCNSGASLINGYLSVPSSASPGLYSILIQASYSSATTLSDFGFETLNGSFYGQILVSSGSSTMSLSFPADSRFFEGQTFLLTADIRYPSGQEVTLGDYTAILYPQELANQYKTLSHYEYVNGLSTNLEYDPSLSRWVANLTLPSPYAGGSLSPSAYSSYYYAGPYDVFATGHSFDGVPTDTGLSTQMGLTVLPYVYLADSSLSAAQAQSSGWALSGVTISGPASLSGDVFLGNNTISGGNVTISRCEIDGTLTIANARVTLVGVVGANISATGSTITLVDSALTSLTLSGSRVSLASSSFKSISPSTPTIQLVQPSGNASYSGLTSFSARVTGQQISSVWFSIDGSTPVQFSSSSGGAYAYSVNTTRLADGIHVLTVTAEQTDGLSSSVTAYFGTANRLVGDQNTIGTLSSQLASQGAKLNSQNDSINSLNASLTAANNKATGQASTITTLTDLVYVMAIIAVVALALSVVALSRRRPPQNPPTLSEAPNVSATPPAPASG